MRTVIKIVIFLAAVSSFFPPPACAVSDEGEHTPADFSSLSLTGTYRVKNVTDPLTMVLENGKTVRLAGIDLPDFDVFEPGEMTGRAAALLKGKYEGNNVTIYQTKNKKIGRTNRMGQEIAHVELADGKICAQGLLLREGLARVRTSRRNPEMAAQMYEMEKQARQQEKGIWGLTGFPILKADTAESGTGAFGIVEGRIHAIATVRNTIYLNFGPDWRSDYTIAIKSGDRRLFIKEGVDPMLWAGKTVRARGWLRSWNGAYMEIDHPQAIELLE